MRRAFRPRILAALALLVIPLFPACLQAQQPSAAAAQPKPPSKLYELRIYTANPGKLPDLHARFRDHTLKLFEKHGMENLYYWTVSEGTAAEQSVAGDMLVYVIAHKDQAAADASWAAFKADPVWQAALAKSEENGKILAKDPLAIYMTATDFSPPDQAANKASDAPARIFELRKYNVGESRLPGTVDRFQAGEEALFRKAGMETLNFWTANDKSAFIYLLAHKDRDVSRASWQAFGPEFRTFQVEYNTQVAEGRRPNARPATPPGDRAAAGGGDRAAAGGERGAGENQPPAGERRGGGRRGGGGGGNEIRFLVPTDYSPRK